MGSSAWKEELEGTLAAKPGQALANLPEAAFPVLNSLVSKDVDGRDKPGLDGWPTIVGLRRNLPGHDGGGSVSSAASIVFEGTESGLGVGRNLTPFDLSKALERIGKMLGAISTACSSSLVMRPRAGTEAAE